jgi:hypothetical protein
VARAGAERALRIRLRPDTIGLDRPGAARHTGGEGGAMRRLRVTHSAVGGAALLLPFAVAHGIFVGLEVEVDPFALDGVTPLADLPGYQGQWAVNVYARFTDFSDQCVGVVGTAMYPFEVGTCHGSDFVNSALGDDLPPASNEAVFLPSLNWDSFYTIGARLWEELPAPMIVVPFTPGPNTQPWPEFGPGANMGWTQPPTLKGLPNHVTLAGPDRRVLLMRLVVPPGEGLYLSISLLVFESGQGSQVPAGGHFPLECGCTGDAAPPFDFIVDVVDLVYVIVHWGEASGSADIDGDGVVGPQDLALVIQNWGTCL